MPVLTTLRLWCLTGCLLFPLLAMAQLPAPGSMVALPEVQAWLLAHERETPSSADIWLLRVAVLIPPDHHGYLDAGDDGLYLPLVLTFPGLEARGVQVTLLAQPPGEREEAVHATVLRGAGAFTFRLHTPPAVTPPLETFPLHLRSQICNDRTKLCYPPQERLLLLQPVAAPGAPLPGASVPPPPTTLNERLTTLFGRQTTNLPLAFALIFAAGLLALVTPCVYPMLPITAAIFAARGAGSQQRQRGHALIYFLGIMCFYTALGAMAAFTGTALSAAMTYPWLHVAFAGLFAALGLSMLGLYELTFLTTVMTKVNLATSHLGGFSGTFCMGATTGLIVSPCVGPITGTILLDITGQAAQTQALTGATSTTALLRGITLMTGFGLGLGLPFLLIGLLSSRLPASGTWLTKTKYLLALPTLYFAYTYYMKGMEIAAFSVPVAHTILAALLVCGPTVWLAIRWPLAQPRTRYASSAVLLVLALGLAYSAWRTPAPSPGVAGVEIYANLHWGRDWSAAQARARAERKPLFVDFYATWCANCKAFQQLTASDQQLNSALQEAVLVKIYDTDPIFRTLQQEPHYPELRGVGGQPLLPLFAIYAPQGRLVWKGQDYQAAQTMIAQLDQVKRAAIP